MVILYLFLYLVVDWRLLEGRICSILTVVARTWSTWEF